MGYGTYVIQDYLKGVAPNRSVHPDFNTRDQVVRGLYNQATLIHSLSERIDSILANLEVELATELRDNELAIAKHLAALSLRASGALAGVIIESHLQSVAQNHGIKIAKKHPTIADLNDPLKNAGVIQTATWRKITYLGDLRNLCSHKKDAEPKREQVEELLDGTEWLFEECHIVGSV